MKDKNLDNEKVTAKALEDDKLSEAVGGTSKVSSLTYKGQSRIAKSATYNGENRKAGNLLHTEEASPDGKLLSGDVNDKGSFC